MLNDIGQPHPNDVLCGRGYTTNRHPGNERFRSLIGGLNKVVQYEQKEKKEKNKKTMFHSVFCFIAMIATIER